MLTLDWTLLVSAVIFLVTLWVLNSVLFRPLLQVLDDRRALSTGTRTSAERDMAKVKTIEENCGARTKEARHEGYIVAEQLRRKAMETRQGRVVQAREEAQQRLTKARVEIETAVKKAEEALKREAEDMARFIAARVLESKRP